MVLFLGCLGVYCVFGSLVSIAGVAIVDILPGFHLLGRDSGVFNSTTTLGCLLLFSSFSLYFLLLSSPSQPSLPHYPSPSRHSLHQLHIICPRFGFRNQSRAPIRSHSFTSSTAKNTTAFLFIYLHSTVYYYPSSIHLSTSTTTQTANTTQVLPPPLLQPLHRNSPHLHPLLPLHAPLHRPIPLLPLHPRLPTLLLQPR